MKRLIATLSITMVVVVLISPALGSSHSELADVIQYFAQNYGDASVNPDVPKPPVREADPVDALSPFGGTSSLPMEVTDPLAIDTVIEARFNLGGPGLPDASGGPADAVIGIRFDVDGSPIFQPMPLPPGGFWVPPSGPDTLFGADGLAGALGLDLDDPGIQTFGGDDVIIVRDPQVATVPYDGTVIVRGGRLAGPGIPLTSDCGGNILELGTADLLTGEPIWSAPFAENDIFKGAGRSHVVRCQPGSGWMMTRFDNQGEFFSEVDTRSFTILANQWWMSFHRPDELAGSEGHRTFVFVTPGSNPYQPDTTAFFSHPAFPEMANAAAPLIGLDPFPGEGLGGPLPLQIQLTGTWDDPTDGSSGCNYYAKEYTTLIDLHPASALSGNDLPLKLYDVLSGQVSEGTMSSNGELHMEATGSGEGYTETWQMKGQAVEYLHSDEHGDCLYGGVVTDGQAEMASFFDVFFEVETTEGPVAPDAPTATDAPTVTEGPTTTEATPDESGSFRTWNPIYLIFGGLVLVIGGYWVYHRTRERGRSDPGGTRVRKPPTPGGGTTAPPSHDDGDTDHHNCDWAVYFNSGGNRQVLRPAKGHECCVYDLDVRTVNPVFEEAAKGRQDGRNPQGEDASPDERLRIFDYGMGSDGANVKGYASTRTGPAGRQDWMHGLGDPVFEAGWKSTAEGEQHDQMKPLEEPVDAGVSLRYQATTTLKANLTAGCPDYENTYSLNASSGVSMFATQECTNGRPGPECPVELTASGMLDASVRGDLAYPLVMKAATYPDELERKSPEWLEGPIGGIDSHDHATRPRTAWEDTDANTGANVVKKDATTVALTTLMHLDSGQIVPIEVWDTTERVTTHIQAELDHTLDVSGEMTTICTDGCGGHGRCDCSPNFAVKLIGGKGTIAVDGEVFDIERDWWGDEWVLS